MSEKSDTGTPTRPVLRWHGGKWLLAPWIISFFPAHLVYVEPYGGAASVLLRKPRAPAEVYNDLDDELINLFAVLRERPTALADAIALTPYARVEYAACYAAPSDAVDRARRFVARSFMGQSSKGAISLSGFDTRIDGNGYVSRLAALRGLVAEVAAVSERFLNVIIEQEQAIVLMQRHDRADALFYVDPPYMPDTRHAALYRHEMTDADHAELLAAVQQLEGMVVLSGYPHPLYDEALTGWVRHERPALADGARPRTEVVWLNPACAAALRRERQQAELFEESVS